jgi:hypothetical protein
VAAKVSKDLTWSVNCCSCVMVTKSFCCDSLYWSITYVFAILPASPSPIKSPSNLFVTQSLSTIFDRSCILNLLVLISSELTRHVDPLTHAQEPSSLSMYEGCDDSLKCRISEVVTFGMGVCSKARNALNSACVTLPLGCRCLFCCYHV